MFFVWVEHASPMSKTKWPVVVLTDRVSLFSQVRYTPSFKLYTTYILIFHYTSHPKNKNKMEGGDVVAKLSIVIFTYIKNLMCPIM